MLPRSPRPSRSATTSRDIPGGPRRVSSTGRLNQRMDAGDESSSYGGRSDASSMSRAVRPQRSMGTISYSRSGARDASAMPPPPPLPRSLVPGMATNKPSYPSQSSSVYQASRGEPSSYARRTPGSSSSSSGSSKASSSGSSFLDRMDRRPTGYASSQTSFERDPPPKRERGATTSSRMKSRQEANDPRHGPSDRDMREIPTSPEMDSYAEYGSTLWNRITTAAASFASNVNHAWASNVGTDNGEHPAPGRDSHLTKVIKAYHVSKASSVADLPDWLFSDEERRPPTRNDEPERRRFEGRGAASQEARQRSQDGDPGLSSHRGRGLRDVYDAATASSSKSSPRPNRPIETKYASSTNDYGEKAGGSKAENRLKALRDAKRSAVTANSRVASSFDEVRNPGPTGNSSAPRRYAGTEDDDQRRRAAQPPPRVGLPARPRRV